MRQPHSPASQTIPIVHGTPSAEILPLDLVEDGNPWNTIDDILDLPSVEIGSAQQAYSFDRKGVGYIPPGFKVDASGRHSRVLLGQRNRYDVAPCHTWGNGSVLSSPLHGEERVYKTTKISSAASSIHSVHGEPSKETSNLTWFIHPPLSPTCLTEFGGQPEEARRHLGNNLPSLELEENQNGVMEAAEAPKGTSSSTFPNGHETGKKHSMATPQSELQPDTTVQLSSSCRSSSKDRLSMSMKPFEGPRLFSESDDEDEW